MDSAAKPRAPLACYLLFPGVLAANYGLFRLGLRLGVHLSLVSLVLYVGSAAFIRAFEKRYPYEPAWNDDQGDGRTDLAHIAFNTSLVDLWRGGLLAMLAPVSAWLSGHLGSQLWPSHWPLPAQLALALLINEFPQYWIHRLSHETGDTILWKWHAVHHSPRRLYSLNAMKEHPWVALLLEGGGLVPLICLGIPTETLGLFMLSIGVLGYLQHTNADMRLGPLNHVFALAELHRYHHSKDMTVANTNYGDNLILFDTLFGTRYDPKRRLAADELGIEYLPNYPQGWLAQVRSPSHWKEMKAEGLRLLGREDHDAGTSADPAAELQEA